MVLRAIERLFGIGLLVNRRVLMPADPLFILLLLVFDAAYVGERSAPAVDDLPGVSGWCLVTAVAEFHRAFWVDVHLMCELLPWSAIFFAVEFSLAYSLPIGVLPG